MNKTDLFAYIKNVGYPFWDLSIVDGFKANRIRTYKCEDIDSDAKPDEKLNASLNALEITLSSFKPTDKFRIMLKNSETANGSGIYGPIEFINMEVEAAAPPAGARLSGIPTASGAFAGLPDFNQLRALGYVPESEYNAKIEAAKLENQKAMLEMEYRIKEDNLKREYANKKEALKREIAETQRQREEVNSGLNKFVEVVKQVAPPILGKLFGLNVEALAGAENAAAKEVEIRDEKYKAVEALASELYDSGCTASDVENLRTELKLVNYEFPKAESQHTSASTN